MLQWHHAFFLWFFQRVCFFAYGPKLRARSAQMIILQNNSPRCSTCARPFQDDDRPCWACGGVGSEATTHLLPFFRQIVHYAMILDFPLYDAWLTKCFRWASLPAGMDRCQGCRTFSATRDRSASSKWCRGKTSHLTQSLVYCGAAWCRPETYGWLTCSICGVPPLWTLHTRVLRMQRRSVVSQLRRLL